MRRIIKKTFDSHLTDSVSLKIFACQICTELLKKKVFTRRTVSCRKPTLCGYLITYVQYNINIVHI